MATTDTLRRLIEVTTAFLNDRDGGHFERSLTEHSAICQDAMIFGIDVDDYADWLHQEFGEVVWAVPWLRFTDQTNSYRGCAVLIFPMVLLGRLLRWPFAQEDLIKRPDPRNHPERLELGHVARVIDEGRWIET